MVKKDCRSLSRLSRALPWSLQQIGARRCAASSSSAAGALVAFQSQNMRGSLAYEKGQEVSSVRAGNTLTRSVTVQLFLALGGA